VQRPFRLFALLLLAVLLELLPACADHKDDQERVSTIPWNRPEKWESQGPLGGMMNSQ